MKIGNKEYLEVENNVSAITPDKEPVKIEDKKINSVINSIDFSPETNDSFTEIFALSVIGAITTLAAIGIALLLKKPSASAELLRPQSHIIRIGNSEPGNWRENIIPNISNVTERYFVYKRLENEEKFINDNSLIDKRCFQVFKIEDFKTCPGLGLNKPGYLFQVIYLGNKKKDLISIEDLKSEEDLIMGSKLIAKTIDEKKVVSSEWKQTFPKLNVCEL